MIKGNEVLTAPIQDVLPGVTRDRIIELLKKLNIKVFEKNVNYNDILKMDALFITGTSPKVLPISKVNEIKFSSITNPILIRTIVEYNNLIEEYIKNNKM